LTPITALGPESIFLKQAAHHAQVSFIKAVAVEPPGAVAHGTVLKHRSHHQSVVLPGFASVGRELLEHPQTLCDPCHRYQSGLTDDDPSKRKSG